jgi:hypothetical protein
MKAQGLSKDLIIQQLNISKSTYYRWLKEPPKYVTGEQIKRPWLPRQVPDYSIDERRLIALGIDFEGCIGLYRYNHERHWVPCVAVNSTSFALINYWASILKIGYITPHNKSRSNKNWKDTYHWRVTARAEVLGLLKQIKEYLVVKKRQAQLVIDFIEGKISGELAKMELQRLNTQHKKYVMKEAPSQKTSEINLEFAQAQS